MLTGRRDILWLSGQVFLFRDFIKEAEAQGLEAIFAQCPYGDLTEEEKATFTAAFKDTKLHTLVEKWWKTYDEGRTSGEIPPATVRGGYWNI
ncbi:MAG TPA: hypothetical protein PKH77_14200 [Anaerolineae bacterium]|nr:hypothetical protein [Anaerolineae bacterium]